MAKILNLETATTNCSVALSENGVCIACKEEDTAKYSHAEQLHVFIEKVLAEAGWQLSDLDAIAVGKGPGSYTGLRIGVSAAKGLCFAVDRPLIALPTLAILAHQIQVGPGELILPMLDARRMEVYAEVYDDAYRSIRDTRAEIIDQGSFSEYSGHRVHLIGSGAEKCRGVLPDGNFVFHGKTVPSAKEMGRLAESSFANGMFEDLAYFEPFYLKDFIAQKPKKP